MPQVVDHLAELTGFRDRDVMDVTLVMALRDLLEPESVAIYRTVGESGQERWLTRAHLRAGDAVASADADQVRHQDAHDDRADQESHGRRWLTAFAAVVEVHLHGCGLYTTRPAQNPSRATVVCVVT